MIKRHGISLIETVLTLTAGGSIMLAAVGLVHQTMRLQTHAQQESRTNVTSTKLIEQFRRDIHSADALSLSRQTLEIASSSPVSIAYSAKDNELLRMESRDGKNTKVESVAFDENIACSVSVLMDPMRGELTLTYNSNLANEPPRVERKVQAVAGKTPSIVQLTRGVGQ